MIENSKDINFMKKYLNDLYVLEKSKYCSERAKEEIINKINKLGHEKSDAEIFESLPEKVRDELKKEDVYKVRKNGYSEFECWLYFLIGFFSPIGLLFAGGIGWIIIAICIFIGILIGEQIGSNELGIIFVYIIISIIVGIFLYSVKKGAYKQLYYAIRNENNRIDGEKEEIKNLQKSKTLYESNIVSCNKTRNKLYSLNIIHPKYRNLIAISQINEYFSTGIVSQLEGSEGAYRLLEDHIRLNMIIYQLNQIEKNLNQIRHGQFMLYNAVNEGNALLNNISNNTSAISYNTKVIAENTKIDEYY